MARLFGKLRTIVCLPFSFVYSVHFFLLPGREWFHASHVLFPVAILFLLETAVEFLDLTGVWDFHSLPLKTGAVLPPWRPSYISLTFISGYNWAKFISLSLLVACQLWGMGFESLLSSRNHVFPWLLRITSLIVPRGRRKHPQTLSPPLGRPACLRSSDRKNEGNMSDGSLLFTISSSV